MVVPSTCITTAKTLLTHVQPNCEKFLLCICRGCTYWGLALQNGDFLKRSSLLGQTLTNPCFLKKQSASWTTKFPWAKPAGINDFNSLLTELHIDNQQLNNNQNLVFDPRTCLGLKSLQVLNTSKNQVCYFLINYIGWECEI